MEVVEPLGRRRAGLVIRIGDAALVAAIVLAAALIGIYTRRAGLVAAFWPANALVVGLMIRVPRLARPACWAGVVAGFLAADLLTGGPLGRTLALTLGNMGAILGMWLVLRRMSARDRRLGRPLSVVWLLVACLAGAVAAAAVGAWVGPTYFGLDRLEGIGLWFASELACGIPLLSVFLSAPAWLGDLRAQILDAGRRARTTAGPLALLVALLGLGVLVGGPAAIAVSVPALLWCALYAGTFETAMLTLVATAWTIIAYAQGWLDILDGPVDSYGVLSVQVALALVGMGPIAVSADRVDRERALGHLRHAADRDALTGALRRQAFEREAGRVLRELSAEGRPVAVLMADLDHFKVVNDTYGHPIGDRVLAHFGAVAAGSLRDSDLFGRIGGEEFCILLPGASAGTAVTVAERVRDAFAAPALADGLPSTTVSIGAVHADAAPEALEGLVVGADRLLYVAKGTGRDRVVYSWEPDPDAADPGASRLPA